MATAGYSGKPLVLKLGIKEAHKVAILDNWRNPQKGEADAERQPQRLRDAIMRTLRAG